MRACWRKAFSESSNALPRSAWLFRQSPFLTLPIELPRLFHVFRISEENLVCLKCTDKEQTLLAGCFLTLSRSLDTLVRALSQILSLWLFCPTASVLISHFLRSLSLVHIGLKFSSHHLFHQLIAACLSNFV